MRINILNIRLVILIFFLSNLFLFAQDKSSDFKEDLSDKIQLNISLNSKQDRFFSKSNNLDLRLNSQYKINLNLDYRFMGFSLGFAPKLLNNDDSAKGKTDYLDLGFQFFQNKIYEKVRYSKAKGYYLENTGDFIQNWNKKDGYILFEDLETRKIFVEIGYVFNKNFSLKAPINKTEIIKKTSGSLVTFVNYENIKINSNKENIDVVSNNILAGLNYYHNFLISKNLFVSGAIGTGIGISLENDKKENHNTYLFNSYMARGSFWFDNKKVFFGTDIDYSSLIFTSDKSPQNTTTKFNIFFGYRFGEPKRLNHIFNKKK